MPSPSSTDQNVHISSLDRFNWELALNLDIADDQRGYIPNNLYSIAQSKFEDCHPFGIWMGKTMVGFQMYCHFQGICWISRIMIDRAHQNKGIGKKALVLLIAELRKDFRCKEIRTSFQQQNALAEVLFSGVGFKRIGEAVDGEIVMVLD